MIQPAKHGDLFQQCSKYVAVCMYIYIYTETRKQLGFNQRTTRRFGCYNMENQPEEIEDFTKRSCSFSCGSSQTNMMISRFEVPE